VLGAFASLARYHRFAPHFQSYSRPRAGDHARAAKRSRPLDAQRPLSANFS